MSRDGTGTYVAPEAQAVTGTPISSTSYNASLADIGNALSQSIASDGQTVPTANLPMGTFRHTGVGNGTARTDYAAIGQLQDSAPLWGGTAGGSANARTITMTPAITAYATGQSFQFINGGAANTAAVTLAVNGLTAKDIVKELDNGALVGGEMLAGVMLSVTYNGSQFVLRQSQAPFSPLVGGVAGLTSVSGAGISLPGSSGERYFYFAQLFSLATGAATYSGNQLAGVGAGASVLNAGVPGNFWTGFCWKIS